LVVSVLTLLASQGFAEESSEMEELRALLAILEARVTAFEDGGDPERAAEIVEIRALLATAETRLAGLDESVASPVEAEVSDSQPSEQPLFSRFERDFYGSLRIRTLAAEGGDFEFIDRFSRIGFFGRYPGGEHWSVLGRIEAGVNLVNQNPTIDVGGDPGHAFGEGAQAFTTRLGYVGFETPVGDITWGKQWAVYYDVAEWADQFYTFGGDGAGAYALGDGGINGRAETAAQYRNEWGPLQLGLQIQNRKRTANDRGIADTFGASLRLSASDFLDFGLAYNEVRDGVDDPGPNEPHIGDIATLVGARWDRGPLLLAVTLARGEQRNQDDEDTWFDSLEGKLDGMTADFAGE
jgi:predicted porin